MQLTDLVGEASRQLAICNSCRYCEGYCAVFPALERRWSITGGDVAHLANLCHDCRACYYACMYAPPHEFGVDLPRALADVRARTYREHGWPALASRLLDAGPPGLIAVGVAGVLACLGLAAALGPPHRLLEAHTGPGSLYRLLPYAAMLTPFLVLGLWAAVAIAAAAARFVRATGGSVVAVVDAGALLGAARSALGLEELKGGGDGCYYPDSRPSHARRWLHGLTFGGFALAFAATVAAAVMQDLLGLQPPFPILSPPVLLGAAGGLAMIAGTAGLGALRWRSDRRPASPLPTARDYSFLVTLNLVSVSGMLTLGLRSTSAAGVLLVVHLGLVAALFLTMPYGKFVHFAYRYAALVRDRIEVRLAP